MEWKDSMNIKDSKISIPKGGFHRRTIFGFPKNPVGNQYKNLFHYKEAFPWTIKLPK